MKSFMSRTGLFLSPQTTVERSRDISIVIFIIEVIFFLTKKAVDINSFYLVYRRGFEPPTPALGGRCSIQLSYQDLLQHYSKNDRKCKTFYKIVEKVFKPSSKKYHRKINLISKSKISIV